MKTIATTLKSVSFQAYDSDSYRTICKELLTDSDYERMTLLPKQLSVVLIPCDNFDVDATKKWMEDFCLNASMNVVADQTEYICHLG